MKPLISIIIPSFNRATLIGETLESVLAQTYTNWECIVVDDGSTDNTLEVVEGFCKNDSRFSLHIRNREPKGAQVCRNIGIESSKSDWITFLDSDDILLPNKLELQVDVLYKNNFNEDLFLYGNIICFNDILKKQIPFNIPVIEGVKPLIKILSTPAPMFQTILVHKKNIVKSGFLDVRVKSNQEWDFSIELANHCTFVFIDRPLIIWRQHEGEQISRIKNFAGYRYIINKHREMIIKYIGIEGLEFHYWIMANRACRHNRKALAVYFFNKIKNTYQFDKWLIMNITRKLPKFLCEKNLVTRLIYKIKTFHV